MKKLNRRDFLRLAVGGAALAALNRCAPGMLTPAAEPSATDVAETATALPTLPPTPTPQATRLLRNENRPGFYVRFIQALEPIDPATWALSVEGLVGQPRTLKLADLQALPAITQKSRLKCVEGWSAAAKWAGFRPQALMDLVEVRPEATWMHFYCADDYYESLPLAELTMDRVLFVYGMNDQPLPPEYGGPLRLMVPFKYGYKSPKAILRIVFADQELRGYWPTVGPYSTEGDIQPGPDYALDLDEMRTVKTGGEIIYADGLEAQDN